MKSTPFLLGLYLISELTLEDPDKTHPVRVGHTPKHAIPAPDVTNTYPVGLLPGRKNMHSNFITPVTVQPA